MTYIVGDLDPDRPDVIFTISDIESPLEGGLPVVGSRLVFDGGGPAERHLPDDAEQLRGRADHDPARRFA